jgi:hypothetical protein
MLAARSHEERTSRTHVRRLDAQELNPQELRTL